MEMDIVTHSDRILFDQQDHDTLADWWLELNHWGWPVMIANEDTKIEGHPYAYIGDRRSPLMAEIKKRVGLKHCLWRGNMDNMTREEFEDFWRGHYEGDGAALRRSDARIMAKVEQDKRDRK